MEGKNNEFNFNVLYLNENLERFILEVCEYNCQYGSLEDCQF